MLRNCLKCLLVVTSLWLLAGPLAVLQLSAWGWMIASYSQESSLEQAVAETFSGERPCKMCCMIVEVEEAEQEQTPSQAQSKHKDLKLMLGLSAARPKSPKGIFYLHPTDPALLRLDVFQNVPTLPPRRLA